VRLLLALLVLFLLPGGAAAEETLDRLLRLAAQDVARFREEFVNLIATEHYAQTLTSPGRRTQARSLTAERFLVTVAEDGWISVRAVQRVDDRQVPGAAKRITQALAAAPHDGYRALRRLADEGARYNLGKIGRNFSDPTMAMLFLSAERQPRFDFKLVERIPFGGTETWRVEFAERVRPTLIHDKQSGVSLPTTGTVFLDDNGRVRGTRLRVATVGVSVEQEVVLGEDPRLNALVPVSMTEKYYYIDGQGGREAGSNTFTVTCQARYFDYRRFETSGRIVSDDSKP
jgi:hypothetical protein